MNLLRSAEHIHLKALAVTKQVAGLSTRSLGMSDREKYAVKKRIRHFAHYKHIHLICTYVEAFSALRAGSESLRFQKLARQTQSFLKKISASEIRLFVETLSLNGRDSLFHESLVSAFWVNCLFKASVCSDVNQVIIERLPQKLLTKVNRFNLFLPYEAVASDLVRCSSQASLLRIEPKQALRVKLLLSGLYEIRVCLKLLEISGRVSVDDGTKKSVYEATQNLESAVSGLMNSSPVGYGGEDRSDLLGFLEEFISRRAPKKFGISLFDHAVTNCPALIDEYSNLNPLPMSKIGSGSDDRVLWECSGGLNHPDWFTPVYVRTKTKPSICPQCAIMLRKKT